MCTTRYNAFCGLNMRQGMVFMGFETNAPTGFIEGNRRTWASWKLITRYFVGYFCIFQSLAYFLLVWYYPEYCQITEGSVIHSRHLQILCDAQVTPIGVAPVLRMSKTVFREIRRFIVNVQSLRCLRSTARGVCPRRWFTKTFAWILTATAIMAVLGSIRLSAHKYPITLFKAKSICISWT